MLVEPLGALGRRGVGERGAPALAAVAVERELRDHEQRAAHLVERAREAARLVLEDAEPDDLPAERVGVALGIGVTDAEQHAEPVADGADERAVDRDARLADPLHDGSHGPRLKHDCRWNAKKRPIPRVAGAGGPTLASRRVDRGTSLQ